MSRPAKRDTKHKATPAILPVRIARLHGRLLIAVTVGAIATLVLAAATDWRPATTLLTGWDLGVLFYLALVFNIMRTHTVDDLRARAAEEDDGAIGVLLLTGLAGLAMLAAIVAELARPKTGNAAPAPAIALAMTTIVLSWLFVHTIFAIHYAHEYYGEGRDKRIGGLTFPGNDNPDYWDFVYFSLVIAMTSQVSDVAIESKSLRHVATVHGVLSFFFNLAVLALTINMISNLIL
jgi:uncharacterized membrane protein